MGYPFPPPPRSSSTTPTAADPNEQPTDADAVVATSDYRYDTLADAVARAGPVMPF